MTGAEVAVAAAAAPEIAAGIGAAGMAAAPAAAAGVGATAGSGLLGAGMGGSAASMFAAPAAMGGEAALLGSVGLGGGSAVAGAPGATPFFTTAATQAAAAPIAGAAGIPGGSAGLFGSGASAMPEGLFTSMGSPGLSAKMPSGKSMMQAAQMMGDDQQQPAPAGPRPQQMESQQLAAIMKQLEMQQGGRSNWAGFLRGY